MGSSEIGTEANGNLTDQLRRYVQATDADALARILEQAPLADVVHAINQLDDQDQSMIISLLPAQMSADLLEHIPVVQAVQLIEQSSPQSVAGAVDLLPSDTQADLLGELDSNVAEAILQEMVPEEAESTRRLAAYGDEQAGGLMITEVLRFNVRWTVGQVIRDLQENSDRYRDYQVQYAFVCDEQGVLVGVLRMRDLLLVNANVPIADLMIRSPISVRDDASLDDVDALLKQHHFLGVPVVDRQHRLIGLVQRIDVDQALMERQDQLALKRQGIVGGEEVRSMPVWFRAKQRLLWLSLNIVLNLIAATVIAQYEATLQAVITLAIFLPIISDMSGCSGNQAVAVSIRELMLGLAKPRDVWLVWRQELKVGLINGLSLGMLLGAIAYLWKGNLVLSIVIGIALALNTIVAVSIGGMIPLALRAFGRDPAVASGPLLTTVTDMCGFFLVLSLASAFLRYMT